MHSFLLTRFLLVGLLLLVMPGRSRAQETQTRGVQPVADPKTVAFSGTTYAVVVGISDYENPNIKDLQFANVDARAFAEFLRSPAGGSVPADNITFLADENATAGQVAAALDHLLDLCKEGDRAIIYFSGHGDVERKIVTQPGFLLCRDAPASVYAGGGTYSLTFLQLIISTLSSENKTEVIVFADACHAGKLGSVLSGAAYTAANLAKQMADEIKILSCQPEQLSQEGIQWGGGRGVFSYFLLNGLTGLADNARSPDGIVTVREIERYLEDEVGAATNETQLPQIEGDKSKPIAWVDSISLAVLVKELEQGHYNEPTLAMVEPKGAENALIAGRDSSALFQYRQFKKALKGGHLLEPEDQSAYNLYLALKDKTIMKPFQGVMRGNLAAAFQDEAQKAINDYLASDPDELRKRWAYDPAYERFPVYLEKAAEILGPEHYMYKTLKARECYFRGLNLRLQGERNKDKSTFPAAVESQQEALKWDENAAYAYNELGLLARRTKNYNEAEHYFNKALELSPQWALPWVNLNAVYNDLGEYEYDQGNTEDAQDKYKMGITFGQQAERIDPSLPLIQFNLGVSFYGSGQTEEARKRYLNVLKLDPNYANAYFNLGLITYQDKNFPESERLWKKYSEMVPDDTSIYQNLAAVYLDLDKPDASLAALEHALEIDPEYYEAQFNIAELFLMLGNLDRANAELEKYRKQQPKDPRGPYFLASIYVQQNKLDKALLVLEEAFKLGFRDKDKVEQDPLLEALRSHPGYEELIAKYLPEN